MKFSCRFFPFRKIFPAKLRLGFLAGNLSAVNRAFFAQKKCKQLQRLDSGTLRYCAAPISTKFSTVVLKTSEVFHPGEIIAAQLVQGLTELSCELAHLQTSALHEIRPSAR